MGRVSLGLALGAPVVGTLLTLPSGNFVILLGTLFFGGLAAAMLGQFSITDARNRGDASPMSGRVARCLGWLEIVAPLVLAVLFYVALSQAEFV